MDNAQKKIARKKKLPATGLHLKKSNGTNCTRLLHVLATRISELYIFRTDYRDIDHLHPRTRGTGTVPKQNLI